MDRVEDQLVLGTAGHIDHGKTALIRALTGVDTDRLPEEKARGITIDLGFAPLDLPDGRRVSIVDVPGHEGLVRTMVSGATGIDMVVLVVAADEGVMPQTREHVAICELLGIDRGIVALTKIDNTEPELAELAAEEVAELLEPTLLAGAPILPVSSLTGDGIDALRIAIGELISGAKPRTPRTGTPRLSIDRSFAAKGFGCVVTGTLIGGSFAIGDAIEILPTGRRCRIRGLQSHGVSVDTCGPGLRCAVNLQGVELDEVSRGQVISTPAAIDPTQTADVKLWWLAAAPPIEDQAAIEFLAGTAERRARLAPIGDSTLAAGAIGYARLHIDGEPIPLVPGDRFIARGFARNEMGGSTVGGGIVLDTAPPHRRRNDPTLHADLAALAAGKPEDALLVRIRRMGLSGIEGDRLRREVGLDASTYDLALASVCASGLAAETSSHRLLHRDSLESLERRLLAALAAYHAAEPIRPGMPTGALRGSLPDNVSRDTAECVIGRLRERAALVVEADYGRLPEHSAKLGKQDEEIVARMLDDARAAGLEPPSLKDWSDRHRVSPDHFGDLLAYLVRAERLVRAPGDFWFDAEAVDALREKVAAHIRENGRLETPDYKALIGTTRRTAVPLMELFDQEHFTVRSGDARVLRRG